MRRVCVKGERGSLVVTFGGLFDKRGGKELGAPAAPASSAQEVVEAHDEGRGRRHKGLEHLPRGRDTGNRDEKREG